MRFAGGKELARYDVPIEHQMGPGVRERLGRFHQARPSLSEVDRDKPGPAGKVGPDGANLLDLLVEPDQARHRDRNDRCGERGRDDRHKTGGRLRQIHGCRQHDDRNEEKTDRKIVPVRDLPRGDRIEPQEDCDQAEGRAFGTTTPQGSPAKLCRPAAQQ